MSPTEPGWYPDPEQNGQDRWWDGDKFTSQTRAGGDAPPTAGASDNKPDWASQPTTVFDPTSTPMPGASPSAPPPGGSSAPPPGAPYGASTPPPYGGSSASSYGAPPSGSPQQPGFGAAPGGFGTPGYGAGAAPSAPPSGFGQAAPPYGGAPSQGPTYGGGGFTPPPAPPAQKSKAPWIVGAIIGVVALCCLGGIGLVYLGDNTTSSTSTTASTATSSSTTAKPTTTSTPGKTEVLPSGYKFTHPGWVQDDDSNSFKVWSIRPEGSDPSGGKLAVKDESAPPSNIEAACGTLPSGTVETFQLGSKSTKFCKYVKDGKYVQWEGYGKHASTAYVVLVRYPGTTITTVGSMPASVQKVLTTFSNT